MTPDHERDLSDARQIRATATRVLLNTDVLSVDQLRALELLYKAADSICYGVMVELRAGG